MKKTALISGILGGLATLLVGARAEAQIVPLVERDANWETVSQISMLTGVGSAVLMPRVYYSSPGATAGWKARWHMSSMVPALGIASLTLLVDGPIKNAIQSPKAGCTLDQTLARLPGSGCETFGGPSTHAFASWGATGAGLGIFLVDTIEYSDGKFNFPSFLGNVIVPLSASVVTSVARSADGVGTGPEETGQVVAGALPGLGAGLLLGIGYALFQEPDCAYGGNLFCW